jgi:ankyrin repeat protein
VQYLIESGAKCNVTDRWGATPLAEAIRQGHEDIANYLLTHGADIFALKALTNNNQPVTITTTSSTANNSKLNTITNASKVASNSLNKPENYYTTTTSEDNTSSEDDTNLHKLPQIVKPSLTTSSSNYGTSTTSNGNRGYSNVNYNIKMLGRRRK